MVRKLAIPAAALIGASAAPAMAADWFRVGETSEAITYVDAETVTRQGGNTVFWTRRIWARPTSTGMVGNRVRYEANCQTRAYAAAYFISYFQDGRNDSWTPERTVHYAAPDTIADNMLRFVCNDGSGAVRISTTPEVDARSRLN